MRTELGAGVAGVAVANSVAVRRRSAPSGRIIVPQFHEVDGLERMLHSSSPSSVTETPLPVVLVPKICTEPVGENVVGEVWMVVGEPVAPVPAEGDGAGVGVEDTMV